LTEA
jgi:hypothetical protein